MLDLSRPDLDFVSLATGLGVPATRATTAEELTAQLERALAAEGPSLIEAVVPPLSGRAGHRGVAGRRPGGGAAQVGSRSTTTGVWSEGLLPAGLFLRASRSMTARVQRSASDRGEQHQVDAHALALVEVAGRGSPTS